MLCTLCGTWAAADRSEICELCAEHPPVAAAPPGAGAGLPGAGAVPYAPDPTRLKSPVGLSRAVAVLLGLVIAADLVATVSGIALYAKVPDLIGGGATDPTDGAGTAALVDFSALLATVLSLPVIVVFLIWFHRVRVNADVFAPDAHRLSPGWAVGAWFVPFLSFWRPRRVAVDTWTASTQLASDGTVPRVSHAPVNAWWALWVCAQLLSALDSRNTPDGATVEAFRTSIGLSVAATAADAVAGVLAILFVRGLTDLQNRKATQGPVAPDAPVLAA